MEQNNGNRPTRKVSTTQRKQPNIPSISMDTDDNIKKVVEGKMPILTQDEAGDKPTAHRPKKRVSMTTGNAVVEQEGQRRVADISELAQRSTKPEGPKVLPGEANITRATQINRVLETKGGPFDQYVAEKTAEMKERMAYEDQKREIEEAEAKDKASGNSDYLSDNTIPEIDDEEAEILADQKKDIDTSNIKVNTIYREPEEVEAVDSFEPQEEESAVIDTDNIEEEDYEDEIEEDEEIEEVQEEKPQIKNILPGRLTFEEDTYEYPKSYGDLPTDEEEAPLIEGNEDDVKDEEEDTVVEDMKGFHVGSTKIKFTTDEEDLDSLEDESKNEDDGLPTEDERLEELKAEITRKIKPKAATLNLKGFTIANKSTASNKILTMKETSAGKWVLPTTGITFQIREISGQKIEYLRENATQNNNPTAARNVLKTIYDHIITPKPQSFEQWTKSVAFADYDHLFMGIYLAAFSGSNYMPMTCVREQGKLAGKDTGCGKMFLSDNVDIMRLVKFKDDESKKKFWALYDSDRTNSEGLYVSEVIPISNNFAIEFCEPTLYTVLLEAASYGREFTNKYENIIAFMPYIKNIYWIDMKRSTLVPISYQKYENNSSKTAKSKVIRYSNIFDTFSTDEYTNVVSLINSINDQSDWFSYVIPEMTCPECKRTIPEEAIGASGLVFTRHRLGVLANTSTK